MKYGLWKITFRWMSPVSRNTIEDSTYVICEYDENGRTPEKVLDFTRTTLEGLGGGSHSHSYVGPATILA